MTLAEVKEHYVTWANAMRKLDYSPYTYRHWMIAGRIPVVAQHKIELYSKGALKADRDTWHYGAKSK